MRPLGSVAEVEVELGVALEDGEVVAAAVLGSQRRIAGAETRYEQVAARRHARLGGGARVEVGAGLGVAVRVELEARTDPHDRVRVVVARQIELAVAGRQPDLEVVVALEQVRPRRRPDPAAAATVECGQGTAVALRRDQQHRRDRGAGAAGQPCVEVELEHPAVPGLPVLDVAVADVGEAELVAGATTGDQRRP